MNTASVLRATPRLMAALALAVTVRAAAAETGRIAFPLYQTHVLYAVYDLPRIKQVREAYINPEALKRVRPGEPLPSGTVLTMPAFNAVLDERGEPVKDANGRYIRGSLVTILVMEKRTGWGAEYPDNVRNGEWEYQAFKADKTPNTAANLTACFNCHKPLGAAPDFLFSYDRMKAATR